MTNARRRAAPCVRAPAPPWRFRPGRRSVDSLDEVLLLAAQLAEAILLGQFLDPDVLVGGFRSDFRVSMFSALLDGALESCLFMLPFADVFGLGSARDIDAAEIASSRISFAL